MPYRFRTSRPHLGPVERNVSKKRKVYRQTAEGPNDFGEILRIERMALHPFDEHPPYGRSVHSKKFFKFRVVFRYLRNRLPGNGAPRWKYSCRGKDVGKAKAANDVVSDAHNLGSYAAAVEWLEEGER